jgi:hypothetical protein
MKHIFYYLKVMFVYLVFLIASSYGLDSKKQLQAQLNIIAEVLSKSGEFVSQNINRQGNIQELYEKTKLSEGSGIISNSSVDADTGAISITVHDRPNVSKEVRSMVVTLTPKYIHPESFEPTQFDIENDFGRHNIDTWSCLVNNATSGASFANLNLYGVTYDLISTSDTGNNYNNLFARYCYNINTGDDGEE